jgi:hypothetical protein
MKKQSKKPSTEKRYVLIWKPKNAPDNLPGAVEDFGKKKDLDAFVNKLGKNDYFWAAFAFGPAKGKKFKIQKSGV